MYIVITCLQLKVWSNEYDHNDVDKLSSRTAAVPVYPSYRTHFPQIWNEPQALQSDHWWLGLYQDETISFFVFRMGWTIQVMELKKLKNKKKCRISSIDQNEVHTPPTVKF